MTAISMRLSDLLELAQEQIKRAEAITHITVRSRLFNVSPITNIDVVTQDLPQRLAKSVNRPGFYAVLI